MEPINPNTTPPPADTAAENSLPGEAITDPAAPIDDDPELTIEQVQESLREEWGADYDTKYGEASKAVQHFFKDDEETLEWFSARVGNDPRLVKLAYRLAAVIDGNARPSAPITTIPAASQALDAQLKEFQPGGSKYEKWLAGDTKLNNERLALYSRKHPGSVNISDLAGWGVGVIK